MIYNSLLTEYKSIIGAVCCDNTLTIRVKGNFGSVVLLVRKDGTDNFLRFPMLKSGDFFTTQISLNRGLYFYYFDLCDGRFIGRGKNFCGEITDKPLEYQLTFYDKDYAVPKWLKGGIIYQIFPDRFYREVKDKIIDNCKVLRDDWYGIPNFLPDNNGEILNNDFFGGDLQGIIQKLDYLKSLGVTCIYLNPIFKAFSNHRYDTGDYMQIDNILGSEDDLKQLIDNANDKGIRIILDGVFNHTGSDSLYFNKKKSYDSVGAYQSIDSPYYNWFNFDNFPNEYQSWWGITTLPSTNKNNKEFLDFISGDKGVIEHYTKLGIGGWRLDVVDELPSHFVQRIYKKAKEVNKDCVVIGEVWEDASNKISYGVRREYFQGKELDSVMNYVLKDSIINFVNTKNANNLVDTIYEQLDHYPKIVLDNLMNILSSHDTFRILSSFSGVNVNGLNKEQQSQIKLSEQQTALAKFKVKVATLLQYFIYGVPCIYYGDEIAMFGFTDPLNRACYPWGREDKEMLDWYRLIGKIRTSYPVFIDGCFDLVYYNDGVIVFSRKNIEMEIMIAINISDKHYFLDYEGELLDLLSNKTYNNHFDLLSNSFAVLINNAK